MKPTLPTTLKKSILPSASFLRVVRKLPNSPTDPGPPDCVSGARSSRDFERVVRGKEAAVEGTSPDPQEQEELVVVARESRSSSNPPTIHAPRSNEEGSAAAAGR